ncbi:MAG: CRISPR-associated endonuclease Cas1 [Nitrospirae bacterium]|nr:CRISPR-associated endonuclease Cas1 [Nitrospirota bacterium]
MGTLYIDRKGSHIKLDGNALAFYSNGEREGIVPVKPLKRVVVIGSMTIDTPVLHRFSDEGVSVIFLSGKRARFCGMMHGRLHNNGILRVRQYEKSGDSTFNLELSSDIVRRKILAQSGFFKEALKERDDLRLALKTALDTLEKVLGSVNAAGNNLDSLRGYEGGASAAYFSAFTKLFPDSLNFTKRTRRPPEDPVNAILSLCYTLLHYEMVREIEVIGLDPTIGFYHQFEYGRESLACDLVEAYRPSVDAFVWKIFRERIFAARDFSHEDERPGCYLKKNSRSRFYPLYEEWAQEMRPKYVEEVQALARRIMDGEDTFYGPDTVFK